MNFASIINKSVEKLRLSFLTFLLLNAGLIEVTGQAPRVLPANYGGSQPRSYVRSWDVVKPISSPTDLSVTTGVTLARMSTQYVDGLGRPIQTVVKQGSLETGSAPTDLINMHTYDEWGRESFRYLPSPASGTGTNLSINDGLFKSNPFEQQEAFYSQYLSSQQGEVASGKNWAYAQTNMERSPLNRVLETFAPGKSWVGTQHEATELNRHSIKQKNWQNTATDAVRIWDVVVAAVGNFSTYSSPGSYSAGELSKRVTVDEHGKQLIDFTDKNGRLILKKVQLTANPDNGSGAGYSGWLCTYYLYDDFGNLRCVVQPRGVELIASTWSLTDATILAEQCFRYEYDTRQRLIIKKVPGAGETYMIYDAKDRLVLTQDANMRNGTSSYRWLYTKYDDLNRPTATGLWSNSGSRSSHALAAESSNDYPDLTGQTTQLLSETFYDDYSWLAAHGAPLPATRHTGDDAYLLAQDLSNFPYPESVVQGSQTRGLVTGTKTRILETGNYVFSTNYYDSKGRLIQTMKHNITGGLEVYTTQYGWQGLPLLSIVSIEKAGSPAQTTMTVTKNSYDELGRVVTTEKRIRNTHVNANAMSNWHKISEQQYDALGQLKSKKLAPDHNSSNGLETQDYQYNIRGWLLGVNRDYAKDVNNNRYFGFDLGYDKTDNGLIGSTQYNASQFNGNITGVVWKSKGDGEKRRYDFAYDGANRLLKADFTQYTGSAFDQSAGLNFNLKMGDGASPASAYDANGNILRMQQWGLTLTGSIQMDDLSYGYEENEKSNRLRRVVDAITSTENLGDFKDGTSGTSNDYAYDYNGNLISDLNKNISSIGYNHLNLPKLVTVSGKGTITYIYDAGGNKLRKVTSESGATVQHNGTGYTTNITTTTTYLGGLVVESKAYSHAALASLNYTDRLQFVGMEEGRIRYNELSQSLEYDYMLKDHLGNVRMVLTEEQKTDQFPEATLETVAIAEEEIYYDGLTETQYNKPSWFNDPLYPTNARVARLKSAAGSHKVGPNMILKVMAGDSYNIRVAAGWAGGTTTNSSTAVLTDLLSLLSTGVAGVSGGKVTSNELQGSSSGLQAALEDFLDEQPDNGTAPNAYLNWILLDEQFKIARDSYGNIIGSGYSGATPVGASGSANILVEAGLTVAKSGYLYIYTSNEATTIDVFFDNLMVTRNRGPILEETHYYPFGLIQQGISGKALGFGSPENKQKYNGIEYESSFDINIGEAFYRTHDPQLGRWWQIDPKLEASLNMSPFAAMDNNPVLKSDPLGDIAIIDDVIIGFFKGLFRKRSNFEGGAKTRLGNAFRSAGRHGANSAKIYGGLFATDNNRSFLGQVGQVFSRLTWQVPNTILGFTGAHIANAGWNVKWVDYESGATVLNIGQDDWGGLTMGSYILGDHNIEADANNSLFQHEYGHYLQSEALGPFYLFAIAIPSIVSAITHDYYGHMNYYTEKGASTRAHNYFHRTIKGYEGWDHKLNPVKEGAMHRSNEKRKTEMPRLGDAGPAGGRSKKKFDNP